MSKPRSTQLIKQVTTRRKWQEKLFGLLAKLPMNAISSEGFGRFAHDAQLNDKAYKELIYTFCLIALGVKMAKCDGGMSREEFLQLRLLFPVSDAMSLKLRKLIELAWHDPTDAAIYALRITSVYPESEAVREAVMRWLVGFARCDATLTRPEIELLKTVAASLGVSRWRLLYWMESDKVSVDNPFDVLGVDKRVSKEELKKRYHTLMRQWHPDMQTGKALLPETAHLAAEKASKITAAYKALVKG